MTAISECPKVRRGATEPQRISGSNNRMLRWEKRDRSIWSSSTILILTLSLASSRQELRRNPKSSFSNRRGRGCLIQEDQTLKLKKSILIRPKYPIAMSCCRRRALCTKPWPTLSKGCPHQMPGKRWGKTRCCRSSQKPHPEMAALMVTRPALCHRYNTVAE